MDKKIVVIEINDGIADVVDTPSDVHVAIIDWDMALDGGFSIEEIARMFEQQGMSSDKSYLYAQRIYHRGFDIEEECEQIMTEFLSGTFDQPIKTDFELEV